MDLYGGHGVDHQLVEDRVEHQVDAEDVGGELVALLPLVCLLDEGDLLLALLLGLLPGLAAGGLALDNHTLRREGLVIMISP